MSTVGDVVPPGGDLFPEDKYGRGVKKSARGPKKSQKSKP